MTSINKIYIAAISAAVILTSCSKPNEWTLKGSIEGASNAPIAIEASENGIWLPVDTLSTDKEGNFSYTHAAFGYPDIMRLAMNGNYVYFPVDSIETITIRTSAENFSQPTTLSGSESAASIVAVDKRIKHTVDSIGTQGALTDSVLKQDLAKMILENPAGIVSYYIICKQLGNQFLFDPAENYDNRILGAVANSFSEQRPNDPRTRFLKRVYLGNRPEAAGSETKDTIEIKELDFFDITLSDNTGASHALSDAVKRNKVVLLNFTIYGSEISPALNVALGEIYNKFHPNGFEIYQIAIDEDELYWKQSAKNLPWITVYNPPVGKDSRKVLVNYNVQALPTSYLFVNGQLVERIQDYDNLASTIAKNM